MNCSWLILWFLLFPFLSESTKNCLKPDGACYPHSTTKDCLRDPSAFGKNVMVAQGNRENMTVNETKSRTKIIDYIISNAQKSSVAIGDRLHPCSAWLNLNNDYNQVLNLVFDTVCRNLSQRLLSEGPTIESLKKSSQLFCLPWMFTDGFKYSKGNADIAFCMNPTNSSIGPYCYVTENLTMPCFHECTSTIDSDIEFKLSTSNVSAGETNCHSVCEQHQMDCSFDNFNLIPQSDMNARLQPLFNSSKKCNSTNTVPFLGNDILASIWSFPFYKFSTGCAHGFESRTFVPSCDGNIPNTTEYARVCPCKMKATTTQITKAATRETSMVARHTEPPGKSEGSSKDKQDKKNTIIIACVVSAFAVVIILLIVASVFIYRRKRSKPKISPKHKKQMGKSGASASSKPDSQINRSSAKSLPKTKTSIKSTATKTNQQSANVDHKTQKTDKLKMKMSSKSEAKSEVQPEIYLKVNELQNVKKDFKNTKGDLKDKGAQSGASLPSRTGTVKVTPLNKQASKSQQGPTLDYENLLSHNFKEKKQLNKITKNFPMKPGDKTTKTSKSHHGDTYDFITSLNFKKRADIKNAPEKRDNKAKTNRMSKGKTELTKIQANSFN